MRMLPFFKPKKGFQLAGSGGAGGGGGSIDTSAFANKTDLTAIILTGTTNTSGGTITAGTWFYLNSKLVKAKVDIASNATFTKDTNYEEKTIGEELAELNSNSIKVFTTNINFSTTPTVVGSGWYSTEHISFTDIPDFVSHGIQTTSDIVGIKVLTYAGEWKFIYPVISTAGGNGILYFYQLSASAIPYITIEITYV